MHSAGLGKHPHIVQIAAIYCKLKVTLNIKKFNIQ